MSDEDCKNREKRIAFVVGRLGALTQNVSTEIILEMATELVNSREEREKEENK